MPYIDECIFSCDGFGGKPGMDIYKHCYDVIKTQYPDQLRKSWFFLDDQKVNCDGFKTFLTNASLKIKPKLLCAHPDQGEFMLKRLSDGREFEANEAEIPNTIKLLKIKCAK